MDFRPLPRAAFHPEFPLLGFEEPPADIEPQPDPGAAVPLPDDLPAVHDLFRHVPGDTGARVLHPDADFPRLRGHRSDPDPHPWGVNLTAL